MQDYRAKKSFGIAGTEGQHSPHFYTIQHINGHYSSERNQLCKDILQYLCDYITLYIIYSINTFKC